MNKVVIKISQGRLSRRYVVQLIHNKSQQWSLG